MIDELQRWVGSKLPLCFSFSLNSELNSMSQNGLNNLRGAGWKSKVNDKGHIA